MAFLKVWQPQHVDRNEAASEPVRRATSRVTRPLAVLKGWSPFILASVFILRLGPAGGESGVLKLPALTFPLTGLHNRSCKAPPVAPVPTPEAALMDLNMFAMPGTAVFFGAVLSRR